MPCKKPVDVLFLLKAGEQFEDMKTFVKAFINDADIGRWDSALKCPNAFLKSNSTPGWKALFHSRLWLKVLQSVLLHL